MLDHIGWRAGYMYCCLPWNSAVQITAELNYALASKRNNKGISSK